MFDWLTNPIASVISGLLGAGASMWGANKSIQGQADANAQNVALSREQMVFQERMSGTAYQRASQDLEKAGLNRVLALGSPATTPSGSMANVQNIYDDLPGQVSNSARNLSDSIIAMSSIKKMASDTRLNNEMANRAIAERVNTAVNTKKASKELEILSNQADVIKRNTAFDLSATGDTAYKFGKIMSQLPIIGLGMGALARGVNSAYKAKAWSSGKSKDGTKSWDYYDN